MKSRRYTVIKKKIKKKIHYLVIYASCFQTKHLYVMQQICMSNLNKLWKHLCSHKIADHMDSDWNNWIEIKNHLSET